MRLPACSYYLSSQRVRLCSPLTKPKRRGKGPADLPKSNAVIVGAIQSFLTLDARLQRIDTILKRVGITAFFIYCVMPFFILAFSAIWRLRTGELNDQINEKPAPGIGVKSWTSNRTVWINSLPVLTVALLVSFEYVRVPTPATQSTASAA